MAAGTQSTGAPSKTLNVYFVYVFFKHVYYTFIIASVYMCSQQNLKCVHFFVLERGLRKGVFYIHDCITGTIYI